ncbi:unnamed protein product [Sphenostylis stenocarpa]|uniref:Uncharacterized protein n=1 Tax=Sphenostylis stenocarpa TaxID=92480 RepID=A0AA86RY92_9FABA|nr:unnamed protein product [Sphenostylis stenocarpa]
MVETLLIRIRGIELRLTKKSNCEGFQHKTMKHTHIMTQASAAITGPTPYFGSGPPAHVCGLVGPFIRCPSRKIEDELAGLSK